MIGIALSLAAAAPQSAVTLTDIRMQLYYGGSGRLGSNLPQDFGGWNIPIGAGDAEGNADDLLVAAELQTGGEEFVQTPLRMIVTGERGKVLASRQFRSFLIPEGGRLYLPVWIPSAGCAGKIKVSVRFGTQHKSKTIELRCGE
jgi:hypothetical protein